MTLLTTFTNVILHIKQKTDVKNIALYNQDENVEVFNGVQYFDGSIDDELKVMEHPLENGTSIADHIINDAKKGSVRFIISDDDSSSLNEILDYYRNRIPLILRLKNEFFSNLIIKSKPIKASVQYFNKTVYELALQEVIRAQTQYVKMSVPQVKNAKNASTIKTGQKQAQPSILRGSLNSITGNRG